MNEKSLSVLEQYQVTPDKYRRIRSGYLIESENCLYLLSDTKCSEEQLAARSRVLDTLQAGGYPHVDQLIEKQEGGYLSKDEEENLYSLKQWFPGKECEVKNEQDILKATRNLGEIHGLLKKVPENESTVKIVCLSERFLKHTQELKKIRRYIWRKQGKNSFEYLYLRCFADFLPQAEESLEWVQNQDFSEISTKAVQEGTICHGSYNQHRVLFWNGTCATTDFDEWHYGIQLEEFCNFLRKMMEKQNWNPSLGFSMLRVYDEQRGLGKKELEYIKAYLLYPDKFWKVANQYYNTKKTWMSDKMMEKLTLLCIQQKNRNTFLKLLN